MRKLIRRCCPSFVGGVFGLGFVWFALHPKHSEVPALIGCLWLASLFTVYQSVLFAPLVLYALVLTVAFHVRVRWYEEPWLARTHGASWDAYAAAVRRWLIR